MAVAKGKKDEWIKVIKRNSVVAAVVLFVCVAVYLNWSYQKQGQQTDVGKTLGGTTLVDGMSDPLLTEQDAQEHTDASGDYFANARLNRQQARDSALSLLQDAAADEAADQTMKDEANAAIQTMAGSTVTEAQIENLVMAKGYRDCVAFIGEDSISVVVQTPQALTSVDTARITDIVTQTTGFTPERIKIIEVS